MHFYTGDIPGELPPVMSSSLSLADFLTATADLIAPDGSVEFVPVTVDGSALLVTLPVLPIDGVYTVQIIASSATQSIALPPLRIPVDAPDSAWHTLDSTRREWSGAPDDDAQLYDLLVSAREQVLAFAPAVASVPVRYRAAQVMQARNTWNAFQRNPGGDNYGSPDFTVPSFPLDWHVRQLLRPAEGIGVIG